MKFNLHKFLEVVGQIGPVVLAAVPGGEKIAPLIPKIVHAIGEAEAIKGATGTEKKARVLNVAHEAAAIASATGKVKMDPAEVEAIVSAGVDAVIGTVHVIDGAKPDRTSAAGVLSGLTTPPAPASVPAIDGPRASDLEGGHATHGHGSADNLPADPPPSDAFEGGAGKAPTK